MSSHLFPITVVVISQVYVADDKHYETWCRNKKTKVEHFVRHVQKLEPGTLIKIRV